MSKPTIEAIERQVLQRMAEHDGTIERLGSVFASVLAPLVRQYGATVVTRAFLDAYRSAVQEHGESDRVFAVIEMPADGKMDKQALEAFRRILPDNLMLVALPDPLDADGAQRVTEELSGYLRRRMEEGDE